MPIFRQYLTGKDGGDEGSSTREWKTWYHNKCKGNLASADCQFPFARMAGVNAWQRSIMTVNNGKFYVDTTRSAESQRKDPALGAPGESTQTYVECSEQKDAKLLCAPRSVNEFIGGKTYLMFFVFAKKETKQTYQIYVGSDFKLSDFKGIKVTDTNIRYNYTDWKTPWKAEMVGSDGKPNPKGEVLQVTVDFSQVTDEDLNPATPLLAPLQKPGAQTSTPQKGNCKPASFCAWGSGKCACSLASNDPRRLINSKLGAICESTCNTWAVKDLDCPAGGCLGFSFTLPPRSKEQPFADDKNHRPSPEELKDPLWVKGFQPPSKGVSAGDCNYSKVPSDAEGSLCKVADCGRGETNPPFCTEKPK